MWKSRAVFRRGFSKQLWESASKKGAEGQPICLRISIAAAFSTGHFSFLVLFSFVNEFPFVENRPGRVTNRHPYWLDDWRRLSSAISTGSGTYAQMMSFEDSAIRIMGDSPPERFHPQGMMEKQELMSKGNTEIAAFVGLDWADQKHAVTLQESGNDQRYRFTLDHTPEALQSWIQSLRDRFGGRPVAIAVEQKRGALIYALMHVEFLHLYPVNPVAVAKMREAFYPSGAKDDPLDADLLLDILISHRRHLRLWTPDDALTRSIQLLTEDRRRVVDERTALTNQLTAALKT